VYEIIRTIYNTSAAEGTDEARVAVLQQTLSQLRLTNIATLDAFMNHFTRLIDLTSADEEYVQNLANTLAPCILRPRTETSLTMEEKHASRLIRDLFAHKGAIFGELKRMSSLSHSGSVNSRPRAISTDESNRRAHMEERQRALLEKAGPRGRGISPAPSPRGHRRDRSTGGPETRFPIASPTSGNERHRSSLGTMSLKRQSLEVPDGAGLPPTEVNGGANGDSPKHDADGAISKRDSLGRSGARFAGGRRATHGSTPSTPKTGPVDAGRSGTPTQDRGVTLVDAPMND
jgi:hypothetical protein